MKNTILKLTLFAITLSASQFVSAQKPQKGFASGKEKIIAIGDFYELQNKAEDKLHSQNYRIKTVEKIFSGANATAPEEIRMEVYESASSGKMRVVMEIKIAGRVVSKKGFMMLGKARYSLDASGKWVLDPESGYGSGLGSGSGTPEKDTRIYKFIGKSTFAGKPVLVYEVSGTHPAYFNEKFVEATVRMRYWFSPDGKLLRQEGTNDYPALNLRVEKLVVNEHNARLNIQALAPKT